MSLKTLVPALEELAHATTTLARTDAFRSELSDLLTNYVGRPTPVTEPTGSRG